MKMLSKQILSQTKSLFMAAGIAACSLAAVSQAANAITIQFVNTTANPDGVNTDYNYQLIVGSDDGWTTSDTFDFTNLVDVNGISLNGSADSFFDPNGFTTTTASFVPAFNLPSALAGPLGTFTISSTAFPGTVGASFLGVNATPTGPASTVPFEFSPGLGLILSGTLLGALKLRSKFGKKAEINF